MHVRQNITFLFFIFFIISVTSGCDEDPGDQFNPLPSQRNNEEIRVETCQEHRKCSGDDCCHEDNSCKDTCTELFDEGSSYDICIKYDKELVEQLEALRDTLYFKPNSSDLFNIKTEDLCALLQLSSDTWLTEINEGYTSGNAEVVINWMFSKGILHLFSDTEDRLNIVKSLLAARAGRRGQVTDENALNGLTRQTIEGRKTIFYIADYAGQNGKVNFDLIHNELIVGDICDTENNQPHPNSTGTRSGNNCYYNNSNSGYQHKAALAYKKQACILALYCLAGPDNNSKAERRVVAKNLVKDNEVTDFIATSVISGGLGVTQEAEEWPSAACSELKNFWHNKALNFDLGTAEDLPENKRLPCSR